MLQEITLCMAVTLSALVALVLELACCRVAGDHAVHGGDAERARRSGLKSWRAVVLQEITLCMAVTLSALVALVLELAYCRAAGDHAVHGCDAERARRSGLRVGVLPCCRRSRCAWR